MEKYFFLLINKDINKHIKYNEKVTVVKCMVQVFNYKY